MRKIIFIAITFTLSILLLLSNCEIIYAQIRSDQVHFLPKTPEASLLEVYGNIESSGNTGLPNISIPLHTIHVDGIDLPISLNYVADGIRVNDIATPVGLKWLLNCGGMVSRSVLGIKDEDNYGWLNIEHNNLLEGEDITNQDLIKQFYEQKLDYAPDLFSYSTVSGSSNFVLKQNGEVVQDAHNGITVGASIIGNSGSFSIRDTKGNLFKYDVEEYEGMISGRQGLPTTTFGDTQVSWKPSQIWSPVGGKIRFYYKSYLFNTEWYNNGADSYERVLLDGNPLNNMSYGLFINVEKKFFNKKLLESISTDYELLTFHYSEDQTLAVMKTRLDSILIYNHGEGSKPQKTIIFNYDNYLGNRRLRLRNVTIWAHDTQAQRFTFNYNGDHLPAMGDKGQDAFGYMNSNAKQHLIPSLPTDPADRSVNPYLIQKGILNEIIYPTGGKSRFFYEANSTINESGPPTFYPGLRVYRIENLNSDNSIISWKTYEYDTPISMMSYRSGFNHDYIYESPMHSSLLLTGDQINRYIQYSSRPVASQHLCPSLSGFGYNQVKTLLPNNGVREDEYMFIPSNNQILFFPFKTLIKNESGDTLKSIERQYLVEDMDAVNFYKLQNTFDVSTTLQTMSTVYPALTHFSGITDFRKQKIELQTESLREYVDCVSVVEDLFPDGRSGGKPVLDEDRYLYYTDCKKIASRNTFQYNNYNQVSLNKAERLNENGAVVDELQTIYKYSTDKGITWIGGDTLSHLQNVNIVGIPVLIEERKGGTQVSGKRFKLNKDGQPLSEHVWESGATNGYRLNTSYSYVGSKMVEFKPRGNSFSFLWGYNNRYPLIKAQNTSYSVLQAAVNASLPTGYSTLESLVLAISEPEDARWVQFNRNLRNRASLSNSQIYTYTYKLGVGVNSITDANGITTYYEYDGLGRLRVVRDHEGSILKRYDYHYRDGE